MIHVALICHLMIYVMLKYCIVHVYECLLTSYCFISKNEK